jgi:hypothetical protein
VILSSFLSFPPFTENHFKPTFPTILIIKRRIMTDDTSSAGAAPQDASDEIHLTVHHHGTPHEITLPVGASLQDLSNTLSSELQVPSENQKLLVAPKPGLLKPPFDANTPLSQVLLPSRSSPRFKITLLGSQSQEIDSLNESISGNRQRLAARSAAASRGHHHGASVRRATPGGVHTISSPSSSSYTFHQLLPLSYLPRPDRSLRFLERLRDDAGIKFAMAKHRFSIPLLTEMNPAEHTTMESRTLGLNRNKGEVIELRLRTDAYDGYRDYRTIRKTLCHELAHCVHSEHDRHFWDLTKQIEQEVERADWTRGGHRVSEQEFYDPGDWDAQRSGGEESMDHGGWTGGEFVLGGLSESSGGGTGPRTALSRREILAKAAEDRIQKDQQKQDRL